MNTFLSDSCHDPIHVVRPSLYGERTKSQMNAEKFSILGKLEPNRKKQQNAWRIAWTAPLLALAAVALVVGLNGGGRNFVKSHAAAAATPANMEQTQHIAAVQPDDAMPAAPIGGAGAVMIAAESFRGQGQDLANEPPVLIDDANRGTPVAQTAYEPPPDAVMAAHAVSNRDTSDRKKAAGVSEHANGLASPPKQTAKAQVKNRRTATKDKDVELIGALLAHVATPATGSMKTLVRKPQTLPTSVAMRRVQNAPPARHSVTHAADDSIGSRVARCGELGFFEAEMCRLRVCSDLWGKTPACPLSAPTASDS